MKRRARVQYDENEIRGLRVVGAILKDARVERDYALREWSAFIKSSTGEFFTHTDIRRYEQAGLCTDKRTNKPNSINPAYLEIAAEYTPYTLGFLKSVLEGVYTGNPKPEMLENLIANHQQRVGDFEFERQRRHHSITDAVINRAKSGKINEKDAAALSQFLGIDVDEVWAAAISQLDERINKPKNEEAN